MASKLVRYLLEGDGSVPKFIKNGGHFKVGHELIGLSVDAEIFHIPNTVHEISREELVERIASTFHHRDGTPFSEEEAAELADNFLERMGL